MIVDATDELSSVQQLALRNELAALVAAIPTGGALQFWRVAPSAQEVPSPLGELTCNPGASVSHWIGNPDRVHERYRVAFYDPAIKHVNELSAGRSERESPIMETVQAVGLKTFGNPDIPATIAKHLVLASDLMQNSPSLRQVSELVPFETFDRSNSSKAVAVSLKDVTVELLYLRRRSPLQGKDHLEFWQQYFAAAGAAVTHVKSISGIS